MATTTTTITTTNTNTTFSSTYNASSPSSAASPVPVALPLPLPLSLPLPLPASRLSAPARHRPISPNGPPLACSSAPASAPAQSQPRAPLPSLSKPFLATAVIATAPTPAPAPVTLPALVTPTATAAPVKPEPVPIVRISAIPSPDGGKMDMTAAASTQGPKMSMTSKEWVIPPRPKPGRKPATDTPPTKRKAQNRAAQRAFRERRAARVGELEEQLDQYKQEYDKKELHLKDQIHSLELDVQSFRSRCLLLENMLERERQDRIRVETEAETLRRRHSEQQQVLQSQCIASSASSPHAHNYRHDSLQQQQQQQHRQSLSRSNRLPHPGGNSRDFAISQMITPPESMDSQQDVAAVPLANSDITCGNCYPDGHCACAEEVLATVGAGCGTCAFGGHCKCIEDMSKNMTPVNGLKRPHSPLTNTAPPATGKRARSLSGRRMAASSSSSADHETDFTGEFSRYPSQTQISTPLTVQQDPSPSSEMMMMMMMMQTCSSTDSMPFKDGCGFCKDGTYCACADAAMTTPAMTPPETQPRMPCQVQTPPPSETDVAPPQQQPLIMEMTADGAVKLPPRKARTGKPLGGGGGGGGGSCGTGAPGTCAQCQADPKSGLFCRLMNAKFGKEQAGACCGGKGGGGACYKSKSANGGSSSSSSGGNGGSSSNDGKEDERITLPSLPSLGLSCAEAYQTLSSHRNFSQAANDIGSWLPKLKATSRAMPLSSSTSPGSSPRHNSRGMMPIEVEAASIMSVLKEFDIRFGREC